MLRNAVLLLALSAIIAACASNPNRRGGNVVLTRPDGTRVTCIQPPADVVATGVEASVEAAIPRVREALSGGLTATQRMERIRREIPNLQAVEVLEFRMCVAYGNNAIDGSGYRTFVTEILPMLRTPAAQAYFEERGREEGRAVGFIVGRLRRYFEDNRRYPASLGEISVQDQIEILGASRLEYRLDADRGYVLRFAGADRRLNTSDDRVYYGDTQP